MRRFILSLAVLGMSAPSTALPCGNATYLETNEAVKLIAKAEKFLDQGKARRALNLLDDHYEVDSPKLSRRIRVLTGVAQLRSNQLSQAAWYLDYLYREDTSDTYVATRLGEVLARLPRDRAAKKAIEILDDLDQRDLMADEIGYLALAAAKNRTGDAKGRDAALEKCKARAKDKSICTLGVAKKGEQVASIKRFPQS